jgi:hypothetical protein
MRALRHLVSSLSAAIAIVGSGSAPAQAQAAETRFVQAFRTYCMVTAADSARFNAMLRERSRTWREGFPVSVTRGMELVTDGDPHQRLLVDYGVDVGPNGPMRTCSVDIAYADNALVLASLSRDLLVGNGTSTIILEGKYETEVTRWTTRIGNTDAVIEFRIPTYANAPGRTLALIVPGQ